jgi:hypothetical protein
MQFLAPHLLHLAWLALVPLVLWLYRRQARRVPVSTLLFFRVLAKEHQEAAWLRRLKRWLALALTLAILGLAVMALAKPARSGTSGSPAAVVILLDLSASMAAADGGQTRLDYARQLVRSALLDLPPETLVSLVGYATQADTLVSRSRNRRQLYRALEAVTPRAEEANYPGARQVAERLAALDAHALLWHASDTAPPDKPSLFLNAAMEHPMNAGITAFQLRPKALVRGELEAFVQVQAAKSNAKPLRATLELRLGGRMLGLRELDLPAGSVRPLLIPVEGGREGQILEAELKLHGDCLSTDNAAALPLPSQQPLTIGWVTDQPDPFTELALQSLVEAGRVEILRSSPQAWPPPVQPDVFVFEGWCPAELPADRPSLLLMPTTPLGVPLAKPLPLPSPRAISPDHPVLYGVNPVRLALTQVTTLPTLSGMEPLWLAGSEPILTAGESNGQRVAMTAFSPSLSQSLAMLPQYPLLLGNALHWCAAGSTGGASPLHHTGDIVLSTRPIRWTHWNGQAFVTATDHPQHSHISLSRIGVYQADGSTAAACILGSPTETQLPLRAPPPPDAATAPPPTGRLGWTQLLLWAVLLLLLAESYLFHRRAVY